MTEDYYEKRNTYDEKRTLRAISDFRDNLDESGRQYVDAMYATQQFLEADFCMDAAASADYIVQLERERTLPTISHYRQSAELALDMHRLAMYCQWIPMYRELHSSQEFKVWLSAALDVTLPPGGAHSAKRCRGVVSNPECISRSDLCCDTSPICIAKFVAHDVLLNTPFMPLEKEECWGADMRKARLDARILLEAVCERGVITLEQMTKAVEESREAYGILIAQVAPLE